MTRTRTSGGTRLRARGWWCPRSPRVKGDGILTIRRAKRRILPRISLFKRVGIHGAISTPWRCCMSMPVLMHNKSATPSMLRTIGTAMDPFGINHPSWADDLNCVMGGLPCEVRRVLVDLVAPRVQREGRSHLPRSR